MLHISISSVHVRASNIHKGGLVLSLQQVLPNASQKVESTGNAGISAERNQPLRNDARLRFLSDAFVVDHSDLQLE